MLKNLYNIIRGVIFTPTFIYAVIVTIGLIFLYRAHNNAKAEIKRYETNQVALTEQIKEFKTESGKNAIKITELELTKSEFEKICEDQKNTIKDLNLKLKRVQSVSTTATSTNLNVSVPLVDTLIINRYIDNTVYIDTAKYFEWSDNWNRIEGIVGKDSVECKYEGVDTLTIVATKVPKKFLFFKWGCKYVEINAVNSNPSTKITYNRTVKLK